MDFKNKVVIVTGGSRGIGAETAVQFAKLSANVVIVGRHEEKLKKVAKQCDEAQGNESLVVKADLTVDSEVENIVEETIKRFGRIDVLVNNAGILANTKIQEGVADYDKLFATNLRSVYHLTSLSVPHLIKAKGNIINISSVAGHKIFPDVTVYSMTKSALNVFTKGIAKELAPSGVRVNGISPGPVKTDILTNAGLDDATITRKREASSLLGKICVSRDVADLVLYLASDKANSITGSIIVIDNGRLLE